MAGPPVPALICDAQSIEKTFRIVRAAPDRIACAASYGAIAQAVSDPPRGLDHMA